MNSKAFAVGTFRVSGAHVLPSMSSAEFRLNAIAANVIVCAVPAGPGVGDQV